MCHESGLKMSCLLFFKRASVTTLKGLTACLRISFELATKPLMALVLSEFAYNVCTSVYSLILRNDNHHDKCQVDFATFQQFLIFYGILLYCLFVLMTYLTLMLRPMLNWGHIEDQILPNILIFLYAVYNLCREYSLLQSQDAVGVPENHNIHPFVPFDLKGLSFFTWGTHVRLYSSFDVNHLTACVGNGVYNFPIHYLKYMLLIWFILSNTDWAMIQELSNKGHLQSSSLKLRSCLNVTHLLEKALEIVKNWTSQLVEVLVVLLISQSPAIFSSKYKTLTFDSVVFIWSLLFPLAVVRSANFSWKGESSVRKLLSRKDCTFTLITSMAITSANFIKLPETSTRNSGTSLTPLLEDLMPGILGCVLYFGLRFMFLRYDMIWSISNKRDKKNPEPMLNAKENCV